ncbi:P-loop containing nucleoside triphosphate hydrolase protein [Mycena floridula]|nr:P-loop containing nucleoside triphosphate hydrolase protein [Mycena floridula]
MPDGKKNAPGAAETTNLNIKHVKLGIWDVYEEIDPKTSRYERLASRFHEAREALPFMWRMVKDVLAIRSCWFPLCVYLAARFVSSLIPAVAMWYSGQLLSVVRKAVEERTVDPAVLTKVAAGQFGCSMAKRVLWMISARCDDHLRFTIKQFYSIHTLRTKARLDVPTFNNSSVKSQIQQSHSEIVWEIISQTTVLGQVMSDQHDGAILSLVTIACAAVQFSPFAPFHYLEPVVWAATTKNSDYIKTEGIREMVDEAKYRQEIVAGGMWETLVDLYKQCSQATGLEGRSFSASRHRQMTYNSFNLEHLASDLVEILPQMVFSLRAVQYPATIPTSLVSLNLVTNAAQEFMFTMHTVVYSGTSVVQRFIALRRLYEVVEIPNKVSDANCPLSGKQQTLKDGVAVEFSIQIVRHMPCEMSPSVSPKGELCVIVGGNGSGKSTILKLISRLYDPVEGDIFMDGHNIKTLKLDDLRRATCVLFQDYTIFPLTEIPANFHNPDNEDNIRRAIKLGGAEEFVSTLPGGLDTYLYRPFSAADEYSPSAQFTGASEAHRNVQAAGGQLQRIALSRTFMRTVSNDDRVGMLLFDEPSASLDPAAEHDLFERLRQLRGNKTMFFSSHRFGNLTRHADLILYIHKSAVLEEGTHAELVSKPGGEYARLWNIQAKQFLE